MRCSALCISFRDVDRQVTLEMTASLTERESPDPEGYISTILAVIQVKCLFVSCSTTRCCLEMRCCGRARAKHMIRIQVLGVFLQWLKVTPASARRICLQVHHHWVYHGIVRQVRRTCYPIVWRASRTRNGVTPPAVVVVALGLRNAHTNETTSGE